jgi:hypothetical protein
MIARCSTSLIHGYKVEMFSTRISSEKSYLDRAKSNQTWTIRSKHREPRGRIVYEGET